MCLTYLLIFTIIPTSIALIPEIFMRQILAKPGPQNDEFVCVYQIFCLRRRDAGYSMLDKDFPIYSDWKYYQFVVRSFSKE
jgi:hypothetical protein